MAGIDFFKTKFVISDSNNMFFVLTWGIIEIDRTTFKAKFHMKTNQNIKQLNLKTKHENRINDFYELFRKIPELERREVYKHLTRYEDLDFRNEVARFSGTEHDFIVVTDSETFKLIEKPVIKPKKTSHSHKTEESTAEEIVPEKKERKKRKKRVTKKKDKKEVVKK